MFSELFEAFTKEYRDETLYRMLTRRMLQHYKLRNESESIIIKMDRLEKKGFESNFCLSMGTVLNG